MVAAVRGVVLVLAVLLAACGGSEPPASQPTEAPTTVGGGTGMHLEGGLLAQPPAATGDVITAEQAEAVSGTVVAAWVGRDRALAERFVLSGDVLDELFARPAPSQELTEGEGGYCSEDPDTGGYLGCSYSVVDDSEDGILALATELEIIDGLVMVASVGFADWND